MRTRKADELLRILAGFERRKSPNRPKTSAISGTVPNQDTEGSDLSHPNTYANNVDTMNEVAYQSYSILPHPFLLSLLQNLHILHLTPNTPTLKSPRLIQPPPPLRQTHPNLITSQISNEQFLPFLHPSTRPKIPRPSHPRLPHIRTTGMVKERSHRPNTVTHKLIAVIIETADTKGIVRIAFSEGEEGGRIHKWEER